MDFSKQHENQTPWSDCRPDSFFKGASILPLVVTKRKRAADICIRLIPWKKSHQRKSKKSSGVKTSSGTKLRLDSLLKMAVGPVWSVMPAAGRLSPPRMPKILDPCPKLNSKASYSFHLTHAKLLLERELWFSERGAQWFLISYLHSCCSWYFVNTGDRSTCVWTLQGWHRCYENKPGVPALPDISWCLHCDALYSLSCPCWTIRMVLCIFCNIRHN